MHLVTDQLWRYEYDSAGDARCFTEIEWIEGALEYFIRDPIEGDAGHWLFVAGVFLGHLHNGTIVPAERQFDPGEELPEPQELCKPSPFDEMAAQRCLHQLKALTVLTPSDYAHGSFCMDCFRFVKDPLKRYRQLNPYKPPRGDA